jgi:hypothetical protein
MKILVESDTGIVINGEPRHRYRSHKTSVEVVSDGILQMIYHQYNKFNTDVIELPKNKFPDDFAPMQFKYDGTNLTRI